MINVARTLIAIVGILAAVYVFMMKGNVCITAIILIAAAIMMDNIGGKQNESDD